MIYFTPIEEPVAGLSCNPPAASLVIFRITLESCFSAPAVLQPRLEAWNDGTENAPVIPAQIQPRYNYIAPGMKHTVSVSFQLPEELPVGTVLRSTLHFSGFKNCALPVEITLAEKDGNTLFLEERTFSLPLTGRAPLNTAEDRRAAGNVFFTDSIMKLMSGMDALDKIPSRWIVTEMILSVADKGMHIAADEEQEELVKKVQRTIFYKNGSLVTAGSQILHWLSTAHGIASNLGTLSGRQNGEAQRMLYSWEKWMLNLIDEDIEHAAVIKNDIHFEPPKPFEVLLKAIDGKPDKLFLYFVLGVMEISPRLKAVITQLAENAPPPEPVKADEELPPADVLSEKGSLQR